MREVIVRSRTWRGTTWAGSPAVQGDPPPGPPGTGKTLPEPPAPARSTARPPEGGCLRRTLLRPRPSASSSGASSSSSTSASSSSSSGYGSSSSSSGYGSSSSSGGPACLEAGECCKDDWDCCSNCCDNATCKPWTPREAGPALGARRTCSSSHCPWAVRPIDSPIPPRTACEIACPWRDVGANCSPDVMPRPSRRGCARRRAYTQDGRVSRAGQPHPERRQPTLARVGSGGRIPFTRPSPAGEPGGSVAAT